MDRNTNPGSTTLTFPGSLSARRAWIEIWRILCLYEGGVVALRKESVDRNRAVWIEIVHSFSSLSARRAWIEIILSR